MALNTEFVGGIVDGIFGTINTVSTNKSLSRQAEADAAAKDAEARAAASKENIKLLTSQQQQTNNNTIAIVIILAVVVVGYILIKKL